MENFEFKSQICTTKEQSERLLALGLKKETADCRHWAYIKDSKGNPIPKRNQKWFTRIGTDESAQVCGFMAATFIPAWSLHRLLFLIPKEVNIDGFKFPLRSDVIMRLEDVDFMYERLIGIIERVIKEGYFNKDYLEEKK